MSFLFHHRTRRAMRVIWAVVAVFIILAMVLFFAPGIPDFIFAFLMR